MQDTTQKQLSASSQPTTTPNPLPTEAQPSPAGASTAAAGGFDLNALRMPQNFDQAVSASTKTLTVPIRKPGKQDWFRVHPDHEFRAFVLDLRDDGDTYLVSPELALELENEISPRVLVLAQTRAGTNIIWPLRTPSRDGRQDEWMRSGLEAMRVAKSEWTRMSANMHLGAYEVRTTGALVNGPTWPSETFEELLQIAFRDRIITSVDHPAVRRLRGEI
jgi:hypothetical protein